MKTNLLNMPNSVDYAGGTVIHLTGPVLGIVAAVIIGIVAYKILWKRNSN
jgi:ammonia channel protein AmtB